MKLTIEPTEEFFMAGPVMCRLWRGQDDAGVAVSALISVVRFEGEPLEVPGKLVSIPPPTPRDMRHWAEAILEGGELRGAGRGPG